MESLIRLWHIFSRKFESIIISISLFCFVSDGKQFCSIKIISLSGISTGVSRTRNHETRLRLVFDLHWSKTGLEIPVFKPELFPFPEKVLHLLIVSSFSISYKLNATNIWMLFRFNTIFKTGWTRNPYAKSVRKILV